MNGNLMVMAKVAGTVVTFLKPEAQFQAAAHGACLGMPASTPAAVEANQVLTGIGVRTLQKSIRRVPTPAGIDFNEQALNNWLDDPERKREVPKITHEAESLKRKVKQHTFKSYD